MEVSRRQKNIRFFFIFLLPTSGAITSLNEFGAMEPSLNGIALRCLDGLRANVNEDKSDTAARGANAPRADLRAMRRVEVTTSRFTKRVCCSSVDRESSRNRGPLVLIVRAGTE